jgi:glycosyltransferase involved in cell wall biosynthesis
MDYVIIANSWSAGKDNPTSKHRIALELARRGYRVLWIEGSGMRAPRLGSGQDRLRIVRKVAAALRGAVEVGSQEPGARSQETGVRRAEPVVAPVSAFIWVLSPLFVPLPRHEIVRRLNGAICRWSARFWGWRLGFRHAVLINYVPVLAEAMRRRRGWRTVYHCVDRWDAFTMYDSAMMADMDRRCCRYADLVIASSRDLEAHCRTLNGRVHLVTHGVDHEHFAGACTITASPSDLPGGPIVGFFGLLSEWVDQDLVLETARRIPQAHVVLIGRADVDISRLTGQRNIHVLGPRPFDLLPQYVASFAVGLIPFTVNDLTRAVNPIKLREMLAGGCPVVSTDLPEVRDCMQRLNLESYVRCAANTAEFVSGVRQCIEHPLDNEARRTLSGKVARESWVGKVDEILACIGADNP